jgi:Nup85 Nucleoporin
MSSPRITKRVQPIAWDAQNLSCLYIPTVSNGNLEVNQIWADPGVGCNEYELSALMKIIQYHEEYMTTKADVVNGNNNAETTDMIIKRNLRILSTKYRAAVRDCLADWERSMETNANNMIVSEDGMNSTNDHENFELLQMVHSMIHLADIFLPLLPSSHSWDYPVDPYQKPGIATSDTVRYLRYHHLGNAEDQIPDLDSDEVDEMLKSAQPELFKDGRVYWNYVCQLALRGCLDDVWNVLSKHSLYVTATSVCSYSTEFDKNNPNHFAQMLQVCEGFSQLKELLFRAPLPGGRNDRFDDVLMDDNLQEPDIDMATLFLDGLYVDPGDFQLWDLMHESIDFPVIKNEKEAIQRYRQWSQFVKEHRRAFKLSKRLREVDLILAILSGDFSCVSFNNWAQMLCAELLYQHPEYRPIQISKRTQQIVNQFKKNGVESSGVDTDTLVRVMEGDAAVAIEWIYVAGGAAGAPLPSTLVRHL